MMSVSNEFSRFAEDFVMCRSFAAGLRPSGTSVNRLHALFLENDK